MLIALDEGFTDELVDAGRQIFKWKPLDVLGTMRLSVYQLFSTMYNATKLVGRTCVHFFQQTLLVILPALKHELATVGDCVLKPQLGQLRPCLIGQ